jgi:hypothetical protein
LRIHFIHLAVRSSEVDSTARLRGHPSLTVLFWSRLAALLTVIGAHVVDALVFGALTIWVVLSAFVERVMHSGGTLLRSRHEYVCEVWPGIAQLQRALVFDAISDPA